jgi:hypothetical protein
VEKLLSAISALNPQLHLGAAYPARNSLFCPTLSLLSSLSTAKACQPTGLFFMLRFSQLDVIFVVEQITLTITQLKME